MKPYMPDSLPLENLDFKLLLPLVGKANVALARYDGLLQGIPNPEVMLSPLITQEAVLSSKIEGTQATVDEVLEHDAGLEKQGEKYKDIQEISNYRRALYQARDYLIEYPIRLGFVRELHKILMDSARGRDKLPGEFRLDQNWIGPKDCLIEQAKFVPPSPLVMQDSLHLWESYLDLDDSDFLLQTAVVHAQFELIHPFLDGNGRIGRILIPLFLFQKRALSQPMFYLSEHLEAHRDEYYQRLKAISVDRDWNGWIAFFLRAIIEQSQGNAARVQQIMNLYDEMKSKVQDVTHSQYSVFLLDAIFNKPVFTTSGYAVELESQHNVHSQTTLSLLRKLKKCNILKELRSGTGRRAAVLCFPALINLVEGREIL